jgi:hypothetical protein
LGRKIGGIARVRANAFNEAVDSSAKKRTTVVIGTK